MNLADANVVVTGAASGIGLACCERFAALGARVWGIDKPTGAARAATSDVREIECDVSDPTQVEAAVTQIFAESGRVDVLLNNAAILRDQMLVSRLGKRVKKHSVDDWTATIATNLTGTFLVAREIAARWVLDRSKGLIINTSSVVRSGNAGQSAYAATKSAVDALTVTWSQELAMYGIRVAAIAYGFAKTGMTDRIHPIFLDKIKSMSLAKRFATLEELVQGVRFICENEYFVGKVLELDGGLRF